MSKVSEDAKREPHVVIVGAGLAGISAAIALKRQLGFERFTIYEKADAVGGTWRDNTYPGCGCDVPGHWYSLSTDPNPYWQTYYPKQPEIRAYWEGLWRRYGLQARTVFGAEVVGAVWSERGRYTVTVEGVRSGGLDVQDKGKERWDVEAEVVIYAIGGFFEPMYPPDVSGRERFEGEMFHSARWRHEVVLAGKRVGVIGNGCSAAQFVPEIAKDTSVQVVNFVRTPQWYIARPNFRYPAFLQWMFAHVPLLMWVHRCLIAMRSDISSLIFRKTNTRIVALTKSTLAAYIKEKAPAEHRDRLIPDYSPGCKRIIVDAGYLGCLNQPNVSLVWDAIEGIVEDGIVLRTGEKVPLDVIIFGTGYSLVPTQLNVTGSEGTTLSEYFASKGGPMGYIGTCIPGFPNLFTLLGPNVATGHSSVIFNEEAQINLALQLIRPVLEGKAKSFEVTHEATEAYNEWLQDRLQTSVWTECTSYYHSARDSASRIVATFPGSALLFWWVSRRPRWDAFKGVDADAWEKQRKIEMARRWTVLSIVVGVAVTVYMF